MDTLEMFSGTGCLYAVDYAPYVKSVEAWEIDSRLASILRQNVPRATVRTVDSFVELGVTNNKYDFVLIDPPYEVFNGHCEHFDLFPELFRLLKNSAILVLSNVRLQIVQLDRYSNEHLERRRIFYGVDDPKSIALEQMLKAYRNLSSANGFEIKWSFLMDRIFMYPLQKHSADRVCFLSLGLEKRNTEA
jgi:hypothetical protein